MKGKKIQCTIPRYRFDIFGGMDIVEEVALGYGIDNLKPAWPASVHIGEKNMTHEKLDSISRLMTGFGFMETLNSTLTSEQILYEMANRDSSQIISVTSSKSREHTILRDLILPGLLENLSKNIHETYPQKFFESGIVFSKGSPINETVNLACVTASEETNFSEMKAVLQSLLRIGFNIKCETRTLAKHALFSQGRVAEIVVNNKIVGYIGELDSKVLENFRIRNLIIKLHLEDNCIEIIERKQENSGVPQGNFLARKNVLRSDGSGHFLNASDFRVGQTTEIPY